MLVTIALLGMMLVPALASGIAPVTAPATKAAPAPVNTTPPALTGTPALGQTLSCSTGTWANSPTSFSYAWLRSGAPIPGQSGNTYVVQTADQGHTIACQVTAGNGGGSYTITGLATGSYKVDFYPLEGVNELAQYFSGKVTEAEAIPVAVTAPATTLGVNAELHAGGQISGRVTAADTHAPIANVFVCVADESIKFSGCSLTNATGEYTYAGLPSGSYSIEFSSSFAEASYLTQYYNGKSSLGEAQQVGVTAGTTVAGVDAELRPADEGGQISGTVTKVSGGDEIEGIQVCANALGEVNFLAKCTVTDSKGNYTLTGLSEGSYEVYFTAENCQVTPCATQNYISQYYNGVASSEEATPVIVLADNTTPEIDAKMAVGGQLEGRVVGAVAGEPPLEGIEVCASEADIAEDCAETKGNGEYKLEGLPTGASYKVDFSTYSVNYLSQSVEGVSIKAGSITHEGPVKLLVGGQISGRVTGAPAHVAMEKTEICTTGASPLDDRCASSNSNGEYTISGLAGGTYAVNFYPYGESVYVPQTQNGVSVIAGNTTAGIDAELQLGGQISGVVTDAATHAGIAKIEVCAETISSGKCAVTDTGASSASANSNLLAIPGEGFTLVKVGFDPKTKDLDFFFDFPSAGVLKWSLFFKNADVGFADSLGLSLHGDGGTAYSALTQPAAEAARKHRKRKICHRGTIKNHGKCAHLLVPFGSGSQSVAAGAVEVKVHASSKATRALKSGHTLHVSGTFTFQSAFGGPAIGKVESAVVHPPKRHHKGKKH